MDQRACDTDCPVLIAGSGPIGLALAADRSRRGVKTQLVERKRTTSARQRCSRSACAPWSAVAGPGAPLGFPFDSAFVTSMADWELARMSTPVLAAYCSTPVNPERGLQPDGHVAWRGNELPPSCADLIDTVRCADAHVAARRAAPAAAAT